MTLTYTPDCFGERLVRNQSAPIDWGSVVFFGGGQFPYSGDRYQDSSARCNHGTLIPDAATGPQWVWDDYLQRWSLKYTGANYVAKTLPIPAVPPFTLCCWCLAALDGSSQDVISIGAGASVGGYRLNAGMATAGDPVRAITYGSNPRIATAGTIVVGRWCHIAATFESTASRTAWFNGTPGAAQTTNETPSASSLLNIAGLNSGSAYFTGSVADPFYISAALSPAQITWLANPTNRLLVPRQRYLPVAVAGGETPTFKPWWASRCNHLIGAGV